MEVCKLPNQTQWMKWFVIYCVKAVRSHQLSSFNGIRKTIQIRGIILQANAMALPADVPEL